MILQTGSGTSLRNAYVKKCGPVCRVDMPASSYVGQASV
ncbi:MAG: hypothetical protein RHS_3641 [Robinsoniella sp. RHS]|nr:MAG: hypothetical protein RHS_3641 [Robinsoniella sp. RHS]